MSEAALPPSHLLDRASLLEHRGWVRAVARGVLRDSHAADDVEQQTWVSALSSPPDALRSVRGWIGTVTRNAARKHARSEGRRAVHERAVPTRPDAADPGDVVQRAEAHRHVVRAVLALPETQRVAVLMRFYEDLSVREIARRTGAPYETVRDRLRRALATLRRELAPHGPGPAWTPGLVLLAGREWSLSATPAVGQNVAATAAALQTGGLVMSVSSKVFAGAGVAALCAAAWIGGRVTAPVADHAELTAAVERIADLERTVAAAPTVAATDDAPRERTRLRIAAIEERVTAMELANSRAAHAAQSGDAARGRAEIEETDGAGSGRESVEAERQRAAARAAQDATMKRLADLQARSSSLGRSMQGVRLRLLPEAERWEKAAADVGLSDVQIDALKTAVSDRNAAYADATTQSVEHGDDEFVSVTEVDGRAVELADSDFRRTFESSLDKEQQNKWVAGGFDGAFGTSKPKNRRTTSPVRRGDDAR